MNIAHFAADQVAELRELFPGASFIDEVNVPYFLLPNVSLPARCSPTSADLLLCPAPHSGYPSRLFFSAVVTSPTQRNWNANVRINERNWHGYSWTVPDSASLRLVQLVQEHLRALR